MTYNTHRVLSATPILPCFGSGAANFFERPKPGRMSKLTPSTVRLNDSKHALKLLFFQGGSHFIDDPA